MKGSGSKGFRDQDDPVGRELDGAFAEARDRAPDDVTMRRMWARVADLEPGVGDGDVGELDLAASGVPVADMVRLRATRPARTLRWVWFAGGVGSTAALACAFVAWLWPRHQLPPVVASRPVAPVEARPVAAAEGTIRTGAGERLALTLVGGTEASLESSSVMTVDRAGRAKVDGGEVAFKVPRQPAGHSYVVLAGPYRVVVLGTRFKLRMNDARRVFVDVQDGTAEVLDQARLARVGAGETWASPDVAGPAASDAPAHTHPHARAVALASPGSHALGSDDETEAAARDALAAGDAARALTLYRALAQRAGAAGENAAYEIGKILRDRLGQPANAVVAWRRYRADHPNGILRVETDVSIIETLVHAGDAPGALAEANDFIRNHPDSERRAEIARVAGDLYRSRADYKRAVASYQIALASPLVRDAAEPATFHRAECLVRLGDPAGAEAAREYLRHWPSGRFRVEAERLLESGDGAEAARL
ncbi:MAG TPA: FecR domain-containing protein [Polyangia bacterium]|nr:FecR domain-containing protein [Polyangia bacterium]